MEKKFKKVKENFICKNCGRKIIGSGFTNHCPFCLYSKHVDINPGDRSANCSGLMKPIEVELKNGIYSIWHQCLKCGYKKKNKVAKNDNNELLINISSKVR
jgi:hypothetical protein